MKEVTEISKIAVDRYFNVLALFGYKDYTSVYKLLALLHIEELLTDSSFSGFVSEKDYRIIMNALYCLTGSRNYIPRITQDSNLRYTETFEPRVSTDDVRFSECDGINCLKTSCTHLEWSEDDFGQKKIDIQSHAIHGDITCLCH